jgi:predicted permease
MLSDIRIAVRTLLKSPLFAAVAVLSLALGIGANTAIFTLVDQILLRLLPVQHPGQLVQLKAEGGRVGSQSGDGQHTFSYPIYQYLRDKNTVFSGLTGQQINAVSLIGEDRAEMAGVGVVAGNFFEVLGVKPHIGRLLTRDDDRNRNAHPVAVLQYDFWQTRFAGKNSIVGSTIRLNGTPFTVVGVADRNFEGTDTSVPTRLWVPVMMKLTISPTEDPDTLDNERYAWFYLFGRLKPGVTIEQAQASLKVLHRQRQEEELKAPFFTKYRDLRAVFLQQTFTLVPASRGQSNLRNSFERPLVLLQWLVGAVLLMACANLASLLLARAAARQKEVAIRTAMGARRGQIIRQLLTEGFILAVAGGTLGLALSYWLAKGLIQFLPFDPANFSLSATPDARILLFTIAVTCVTAIVFGLAPALQGSRVSPNLTLKEEAGAVVGGHGHIRLRKALVGLQVGLSVLLLIGAGLFAQTLKNLQNVDLGMKTDNVIMFGVRPGTLYNEPRKLLVVRSLMEGLQTVPGVKAVGANTTRLFTGGRSDGNITIPGVKPRGEEYPSSFFNAVTPGYFDALGIPVKAGRDFTWNDWGSSRFRCLVNEQLVEEYFDNQNPVGRMMARGREASPNIEIIGVFGNARYHNVRGEFPRQTFVDMGGRIQFLSAMNVYARTDRDPRVVMPLLREKTRQVDANLVVFDMRTMDEQVNQRLTNERILSFLSISFALLATLLAIVGLYGVLAFVVERRRREIGIRMALGAKQGSVIRLVVREVLLVVLVGMVAGIAGAALSGKFVESQLFGLKPGDPVIFVIAGTAALAACAGAAFLPAWRASRIDPMRALRYE